MWEIIKSFDINNKPIHLHKELTEVDETFELSCIRSFDYEKQEDYEIWCRIVNAAYAEENYVPESAKQILTKHSFLRDTESFFYLDEDGKAVGTISIGTYRGCTDIAGDFRLAVYPDYQNMGIGGAD